MSYAGAKTKTDWIAIRSGYQDTVDFIHEHPPRNKFLLSGVHIKPISAEYILTRARKRPVRQETLERFESALRKGTLAYMGGFSTIHFDVNGELIDIQGIYELMYAIISTKISAEMNIHFGIPCSLINGFGIVRVDKSIAEAIPTLTKEEPTVPKVPEYVAKYPCKAIQLIMAIIGGNIAVGYNRKQSAVWEKANDSELLEQCIAEGEATSKASGRFLTASEWGALRYVTASIDTDDSNTFFTLLRSSLVMSDNHPVSILKRQFSIGSNFVARDYIYRMALVILAWNVLRTGELRAIQWDEGKEEFPKAK